MFNHLLSRSLLGVFFVSVVLATAATAQDDAGAEKLERILAARADSVVRVEIVIKMQFTGRADREMQHVAQGVVVSEKGLIMTACGPLSLPQNDGLRIMPSDFRVAFGDEDKMYDCILVAKDEGLDLAFLQIKNLGDKLVSALDFTNVKAAGVGQRVVTVARLARTFGSAPIFRLGRIVGRLTKPHPALALDADQASGLVCFDLEGEPVGVNVSLGTVEANKEINPFTAILGGARGATQPAMITAKDARAVISDAKKRAADLLAAKKENR